MRAMVGWIRFGNGSLSLILGSVFLNFLSRDIRKTGVVKS